jgi:hypothetical protein
MRIKRQNIKRQKLSLKRAIDFEYEPVIRKLQNQGYSKREARSIFEDLKRFLWLCAFYPTKSFAPTPRIDIGWHALLEFTETYLSFCRDRLGRFVHHVPKEALPDSLLENCRSCVNCTTATLKPPKGISIVEQTLSLAHHTFGRLSRNWNPYMK